jgi:hypothetical protein
MVDNVTARVGAITKIAIAKIMASTKVNVTVIVTAKVAVATATATAIAIAAKVGAMKDPRAKIATTSHVMNQSQQSQ